MDRWERNSFFSTVGSGAILVLYVWFTVDLPPWAALAVVPLLSLVPIIQTLPKLSVLSEQTQPLRETLSISLGARNGLALVGFATLPLFLSRPLLLGFESFIASSEMILVAIEVAALGFAALFGLIASALDFRFWLGERSLDELKVEDLFTVWVGRKARKNFRDSFWFLLPFILGGEKKREGSGPAQFLTWKRVTIALSGLVVLTLGQGLQLGTLLILTGLICVGVFFEVSSYGYKKALGALDAEKLTLLAEEVSLARRQLASEQMMKHKSLELGLQFFAGSLIAAIGLFIAIVGALSQWPLVITGMFGFLGIMGLLIIVTAMYTLITGRWPGPPWDVYGSRPVTRRSEVQVLDIPERQVRLRVRVIIGAVGVTIFVGSGITAGQLFGSQGQTTIQCASNACVVLVIASFAGLLLAIGGAASTVLAVATSYIKRRKRRTSTAES